jgi:hypothetical protein
LLNSHHFFEFFLQIFNFEGVLFVFLFEKLELRNKFSSFLVHLIDFLLNKGISLELLSFLVSFLFVIVELVLEVDDKVLLFVVFGSEFFDFGSELGDFVIFCSEEGFGCFEFPFGLLLFSDEVAFVHDVFAFLGECEQALFEGLDASFECLILIFEHGELLGLVGLRMIPFLSIEGQFLGQSANGDLESFDRRILYKIKGEGVMGLVEFGHVGHDEVLFVVLNVTAS